MFWLKKRWPVLATCSHSSAFSCICIFFTISIDLKYLTLTDWKSRYDEERSLKEAGDQRMAKLNEQLQKEKEENERLQTELVQHTIHFCWRLFPHSAGLRPTLYFVKAALSQLPCFENWMNNFELSPWNLFSTKMLDRRITLRQSPKIHFGPKFCQQCLS